MPAPAPLYMRPIPSRLSKIRCNCPHRLDPYAAASQEILELVQSGGADRETVGELVDMLLEAEVPFRWELAATTWVPKEDWPNFSNSVFRSQGCARLVYPQPRVENSVAIITRAVPGCLTTRAMHNSLRILLRY